MEQAVLRDEQFTENPVRPIGPDGWDFYPAAGLCFASRGRWDGMTTGSDALFDERLAQINERTRDHRARRQLWLTHHWPKDYQQRCVRIGSRHVCRRCAALYPLGFVVAFLAAFGLPLWPTTWDPTAIWILCIPATVAFVGEAIGVFRYSAKWQVAAMLITALAFGRGLGYELVDRWSSEFWGPVAVFGGLWFFASLFHHTTKPKVRVVDLAAPKISAVD